MARILQTFVDIGADIADEDEARIAFAHTDMFESYATAISAVDLIAWT